MKPYARVNLDHGRLYRLYVEGEFLPFWTGNLAAGLAAQRVSIASGRGSATGLTWTASFLLDFAASAVKPDSVDYIALANANSPALADTSIQLTRFECRRLPSQRLEVTVEGPDQTGFMAKLLRKLAMLTLFPMEFEIDTPGGRIQDRLILGGIGGAAPSAELQATLERTLQSCVAR